MHTAASEEADERLETEAMAQSHNNKLKRQQGWVIILFRVVTTINNLQETTAVVTYNPPLWWIEGEVFIVHKTFLLLLK